MLIIICWYKPLTLRDKFCFRLTYHSKLNTVPVEEWHHVQLECSPVSNAFALLFATAVCQSQFPRLMSFLLLLSWISGMGLKELHFPECTTSSKLATCHLISHYHWFGAPVKTWMCSVIQTNKLQREDTPSSLIGSVQRCQGGGEGGICKQWSLIKKCNLKRSVRQSRVNNQMH